MLLPRACLLLSLTATAVAATAPAPTWVPPLLTPQEEARTFQLPPGYHMELVLSEPAIKEPVWCTFDPNGRMYVVEMRSYMQDADGGGEFAPVSRVSRHESTKGDGIFDRHTVFADKLVLPRTVLPLGKGQVVVGRTNTNDLTLYRDSRDSGVADSSSLFFAGGAFMGNMEHQPSGLIWSIDNCIYTTYNAYRLRWRPDSPPLREPTAANGGQWGLTQDDEGKLWFSNAGGEKALLNFQTHISYAGFDVPDQWDPGFPEVWPAIGLADFQGGPARVREPDKTLNHFTACAGQEVYRGDRLPAELRGNIFIGEPVGRLIRRAIIEVKDGVTTVRNPYQAEKSEFLRSTDPYFRPVQIANGPDGCLYIVDMYRGIIQEGNWVQPGSYLRPQVLSHGLDKAVGRGRIWRLVYDGMKPAPLPRLYDESHAQLVAELEHPNGWRRDTAQRLLVLSQDKTVVPLLRTMAEKSTLFYARLHALWTLDGLHADDAALVEAFMTDADPRIRSAGIRVSERLLLAGDSALKARVLSRFTDPDPSVALQAMMTARLLQWPEWTAQATQVVQTTTSHGVKEIGQELLKPLDKFSKAGHSTEEVALLRKGQAIYDGLCFACHGKDGRGAPLGDGTDATLAPSLIRSRIVMGPPQELVQVILHGLTGPDGNRVYPAQMIAMGENSDEWVAAVASFVRNLNGVNYQAETAFGFKPLSKNKNDRDREMVSPAEVAQWRSSFRSRTQPWTREEVDHAVLPPSLRNAAQWTASAGKDGTPAAAPLAFGPSGEINFSTGTVQAPGQWFQVTLPEPTLITGLRMDSGEAQGAYPRGFRVEVSADGKTWTKAVPSSRGWGALTWVSFKPTRVKSVRITLTTALSEGWTWDIRQLEIYTGTVGTVASEDTKAAPARS